jgi:hypothetical protein
VLSRRKGPLKLKHTAGLLPKRAASKLLALVPSSIRRLGRDDVEYIILDEPEISSPIIMSCRTNDRSPLLAHFLKLIDEFDQWTETDVSAPRRKGALR